MIYLKKWAYSTTLSGFLSFTIYFYLILVYPIPCTLDRRDGHNIYIYILIHFRLYGTNIHSSIVSGRRKEGRTTKKQSLSGVSMNGLCSSFRCTLRNKKFLISFSGSLDRGLLYAKVGPTEVYYFVACRFQ